MGIINSQNLYKQLSTILDKMDACAENMEGIVQQEEKATHSFDGDMLKQLAEQRVRSQSKMVELESQCRRLLKEYWVPDAMSLESFIEAHAQRENKQALQGKRQQVLVRMERMHEAMEENRIRLHAAWCVSMHVLQEVGALPKQESYGRGVTG